MARKTQVTRTEIRLEHAPRCAVVHHSEKPEDVIIGLVEGTIKGARALDELIAALQEIRTCLPGCGLPTPVSR